MARGVNEAILIGNLGADPEVRYTATGTAVASVSLATSESWKDKVSGERKEQTEWHRLVAWSPLAEVFEKYLRKGSKVYVRGKIQTRKWTDRNSIDRWTTEIVVRDMHMLDSKPAEGRRPLPPRDAQADEVNAPPASKPATEPAAGAMDDLDDFDQDVPF